MNQKELGLIILGAMIGAFVLCLVALVIVSLATGLQPMAGRIA